MGVPSHLGNVGFRCSFLFPRIVQYEMVGVQIVPHEVNRLLLVLTLGNFALAFGPPRLA